MRYISDDGKVFNTEQECCEHERQVENQRVKRDQLEKERQDRLGDINKKYEELQNSSIDDLQRMLDELGD